MAKPRKKKNANKDNSNRGRDQKDAAAAAAAADEPETQEHPPDSGATGTPKVSQRRSRRSLLNTEPLTLEKKDDNDEPPVGMATNRPSPRGARSASRKAKSAVGQCTPTRKNQSCQLSKNDELSLNDGSGELATNEEVSIPESSIAESEMPESSQSASDTRSKSAASKAISTSEEAAFFISKIKGKKTNVGSNSSSDTVKGNDAAPPKTKGRKSAAKVKSLTGSPEEPFTPKSKAKASTPKVGSQRNTPKESELVTPKSKLTPGSKKSSVKSNRTKKSKAKTSTKSVERNTNDSDGDSEAAAISNYVQEAHEEKQNQRDGISEEEPMDVAASPAYLIISEPPETGGRSRRSAAIKARKSFQSITKGLLDDDEDGRTKKGNKKKSKMPESDEDSDADPDVKIEDNESSSEDSESGEQEESSEETDDSFEEEDGQRRGRGVKTTKKPESEMPYIDSSNGHMGATVTAFYKLYTECERSKLFYSWRPKPSHWKQLSESEMEPYLPFFKTSLKYSMGYSSSSKSRTKCTLDLFESQSQEYKMCFTGGPIRAMNWCPVSAKDKQAQQVMAVYAVHHPDFRHTPHSLLQLPSLIQIWNFGNLKEAKECAPVMRCGLAVDFGPIHELKWCPFGAYDDPESAKENQYDTRLGLLAVAACDGFAYIYSIPHLQQLPKNDDASHPIFRVQPVAKLVPSLFDTKGLYGPCMCLDWQWKDSASRLFAGFGRGQVAVWQLDTDSALLRKKSDNGTDLLSPILSISAHRDVVTAVAICQNVPDYFSTVSHDRFVKIWDLKRPEALLNQQYRFLFNCVVWPPQHSSNMLALDYGPGNYWLMESGYFGAKGKPMVPHMDTCWHIDYNPWLRAGASVDGDGVLAVTILPNLLVHRIHSGMYRHSCYVVTANATIDQGNEANCLPSQSQKGACVKGSTKDVKTDDRKVLTNKKADKDTSDEEMEMCEDKEKEGRDEAIMDVSGESDNATGEMNEVETGQDTVCITQETTDATFRKCRDSFEDLHHKTHVDYSIDTSKDFGKQSLSRFKLVHDMRKLPIQAMYRTAWNQNIRWRTWVSFGGQAGILSVVNFPWHDDKTASKICKDIR